MDCSKSGIVEVIGRKSCRKPTRESVGRRDVESSSSRMLSQSLELATAVSFFRERSRMMMLELLSMDRVLCPVIVFVSKRVGGGETYAFTTRARFNGYRGDEC